MKKRGFEVFGYFVIIIYLETYPYPALKIRNHLAQDWADLPKCTPDIGRNMHNKIIWFLILGLMVLQSGCALEKYRQGSEDYSSLRYSQDEARSGTQSGPAPG